MAHGETRLMVPERLVAMLESGMEKVLLIDSRPFVEYNTAHILDAVNINCSKLMKRRLQQDKVVITELIQHSAKQKVEIDCELQVVVYDQSSPDVSSLPPEGFLAVLLGKLQSRFCFVHLLAGGFAEFASCFPGLCEGKAAVVPSCISQPCLPVSNIGPTRILPHLYLGCQRDVLNRELMQQNEIGYVVNASNTCPKPDFIPESHFLRVPVNDSFCEKILPWLDRSVDFIEKAKANNGRVLVHCLAGISRSATIAIAYIMNRMDMSLDEAYRFVKEKRPTISPNFNFLGQLLDFEKKIKSQTGQTVAISKLKLLHMEKASENTCAMESRHSGGPAANLLSAASTSEIGENTVATTVAIPQPVTTETAPLLQGINGLHVSSSDWLGDSNRLKRSFSLDIKAVPYSTVHGAAGTASSEENPECYKPSMSLDVTSKPSQFSPVQEVSEQTPEPSPDKEVAGTVEKPPNIHSMESKSSRTHSSRNTSQTLKSLLHPLHRSGSMEDSYKTNFLFGLSTSQQHLAKSAAGLGLKGWHSDILTPQTSTTSVTNSWYFATETSHFYSASAIYGGSSSATYSTYSCGQLATGSEPASAVRRRQKTSDRGDSRRSWHEESSFEKQFKRRSCQMEFGDTMSDTLSREELGKVGSQSSFSGSIEIIEVS
ncbi:dual specificity protein phosphatase 16 [Lissotriton helveticus]